MATRKKTTSSSTPPPPAAPAANAAPPVKLNQSDPQKKPFTPEVLDRSAIAMPLLKILMAEDEAAREAAAQGQPAPERQIHPVIIDLHLQYPGGRDEARKRVLELVKQILQDQAAAWQIGADQGILMHKSALSEQYLFGRFEGRVIQELVRRDHLGNPAINRPDARSIYRIWPDFELKALLNKSISTVKADAALNSFATTGENIVWAVLDSGIDALHPHFATHDNLNLTRVPPLEHKDLTALDGDPTGALVDKFGHGTHVAGIIAGVMTAADGRIDAHSRFRDETGEIREQVDHPPRISGMAPRAKLLSLKVLDDNGQGQASSLIAAIEEIQRINGNGRYVRVHGVNLSVGYDFEPEWFACGQSPLCIEVDRLVRSGVVVVVAAGNTGYGFAQSAFRGTVSAGLGLTINDPGNAELAVTVGSTHRDSPHIYGVSYFSSKGPTGDGRAKPDLVAPGEKILSCASAWQREDPDDPKLAQVQAANQALLPRLQQRVAQWHNPSVPAPAPVAAPAEKPEVVARYREDSGTSMAAPHVAGVMAAFMSVRREYIGHPAEVKEVFQSTATDLKRDRYFQGHGLVDLMRAIQSV